MKHWLLGLLLVLLFPVMALAATTTDILRIGESVTIQPGEVVHNVTVLGGTITVKGTIQENAVAVGGDINLLPGGRIAGDATAVGGKVNKKGGILAGSINTVDMKGKGKWHPTWSIWPAIGMLALITVIAALFPKATERTLYAVEHAPGMSILSGILGMLFIIPIAVFLAISIVGIAFIPLEFLAVFAATLLGYTAISTLLGQRILQGRGPWIAAPLLGGAILQLLGLIPIMGGIISLLIGLVGFGAALISRFGVREATTLN